jgi:hypothetical protein
LWLAKPVPLGEALPPERPQTWGASRKRPSQNLFLNVFRVGTLIDPFNIQTLVSKIACCPKMPLSYGEIECRKIQQIETI